MYIRPCTFHAPFVPTPTWVSDSPRLARAVTHLTYSTPRCPCSCFPKCHTPHVLPLLHHVTKLTRAPAPQVTWWTAAATVQRWCSRCLPGSCCTRAACTSTGATMRRAPSTAATGSVQRWAGFCLGLGEAGWCWDSAAACGNPVTTPHCHGQSILGGHGVTNGSFQLTEVDRQVMAAPTDSCSSCTFICS
jgi:hypothetical protein